MASKENVSQNLNGGCPVDDFMSEFLHFVQEDYHNCTKYTSGSKPVAIETDILAFNSELAIPNFNAGTSELAVLSEDLSLTVDSIPIPPESIAVAANEIVLQEDVAVSTNNLVEAKVGSHIDILTTGELTIRSSAEAVTGLVEFSVNEHASSHVVTALGNDEPVAMDTDALSLVSVCPDLNSLVEATCSENTVFEDIELYLECSDDDEGINHMKCLKSQNGNFSLHAGAVSSVGNDMQLKISFPTHPADHENGLKCSACKTYFQTDNSLKTHVKQHHKEVFCCNFCPYNTKSEKFFATHNRSKHNFDNINGTGMVTCADQEQYEIRLSGYTTDTSEPAATNTASTCRRETPVIDEKCVTVTQNPLPIIITVCHQCELCTFQTKSKMLLKTHTQTMHNPDRDIYQCQQCHFTCKQKRTLNTHTNIHKNEYNFVCENCNKKFISKSALSRHSKTHILTREHVCDVTGCNKSFRVKGALTDHKKKVHKYHKASADNHTINCDRERNSTTGDVTHVMQQRSGSHSRSNAAHVTKNSPKHAHVGDEHCENMDTLSDKSLNSNNGSCTCVHSNSVASGRNKKSFTCPFEGCGKHFRDNFNLRCHVNKHTGTKQLKCEHCDYLCIQKASLDYHVKVKHTV